MPGIQIHGAEYQLRRIFSDEFAFYIPHYQRPYAWEADQATELFDDLVGSLGDGTMPVESLEPYFLGSVVLIKQDGDPRSDVVDGQQRLTTLTILLAAAAEAFSELTDFIQPFLFQPANDLAGTEARYRLAIRERDETFFRKFIQEPGGIEVVERIDPVKLHDAQRALRANALLLRNRISKLGPEKTKRLIAFMLQRTYLVAVSTPNLHSAFRIFSVLNERGLDLSVADILKARVLGNVPTAEQEKYTNIWEDFEERLGRDSFSQLMSHIRMIFARAKLRETVVKEFDTAVFTQVSPGGNFIDRVLVPYGEAMDVIIHRDFIASDDPSSVNTILTWLDRIDNSDWIPVALVWIAQYSNDLDAVATFMLDLERLAASMLIRRVDVTRRIERYGKLLSAIEEQANLFNENSPLQLSAEEKKQTLSALQGSIYLTQRVRTYVLPRLDAALSSGGATYDSPVLTIEHVLPQTMDPDSDWARNFSQEVHDEWVHRLANLVLLTRRKNSQASNYAFDKKKELYFTGRGGTSPFVLTTQVLTIRQWTERVLKDRQARIIEVLSRLWRLS